ncbi:MAG: hypothetical protein ACI97B_002758 [Verrucomicrobiales bacterium]|jgi:hypothetical protein
MNKCMKWFCVSLCSLAAMTQAEDWFLSVGPYVRQDMRLMINGSSEVQGGGMHVATPFFQSAQPAMLGNRGFGGPAPGGGVLPISNFANRTYDDGFVNIGSTTGVGGSLAPDHTWFWGYQSRSQYDAAANTVTFHKTVTSGVRSGIVVDRSVETRRSVQTLRDVLIDEDHNVDGAGLEVVLGRHLGKRGVLDLSVALGLNGIEVDQPRLRTETFREEVSTRKVDVITTHRYADRYTAEDEYVYRLLDTSGNPITPRAPGDAGTFNGLPLPSPLIPNRPESQRRLSNDPTRTSATSVSRGLASTDRFEAWNEIDIDVETDVFQLWAGPEFKITGERLSIYGRPKISLNLIDLGVDRHEVFKTNRGGEVETLQTWNDSKDVQVWSFGYGIIGGVQLQLMNAWYIAAEISVDEIDRKAKAQVGPNHISFDASGESGSLRLGRNF